MKSLRSEAVDVDAKGKRCKERRAVVLRRSPVEAADAPLEAGWRVLVRDDAADFADRCVAGACRFEAVFRDDDSGGGCLLDVRVRTGKQRTAAAVVDGAVVVDVAAAPREGAANEAVLAFLAAACGARRTDVSLASGHKSRDKVARFAGLGAAAADARFRRSLLAGT